MSRSESPARSKAARRQAIAARAKKNGGQRNGRSSLTKEDWLRAALEVLNERGVDSVKVLPLSKKLGVTRGSFYWHFEDRDQLLREMLQYWESDLTDSVIDHVRRSGGTPRQRLEEVLTNVLVNERNLYDTAIAAWSMSDKSTAAFHDRVSRKRQRFMQSLMVEAGVEESIASFRTRLILSFMCFSGGKSRASHASMLEDVRRCCDLAFS